MPEVCLHFNLHQPNRLKEFSFFEIGRSNSYDNDSLNLDVLNQIADNCYLKMNSILMENIKKFDGQFKVAFSISGTLIEQLEKFRPDVIASFKEMTKTGCVEIVGSTYYNSLSSVYSKREFYNQMALHSDVCEALFGQRPKSFQNTGMIYNNELAADLELNGIETVLSEGLEWYLGGRTSNCIYKAPNVTHIKTLCKNRKLVEDITHRFNDKNWEQYPLTAKTFAKWVMASKGDVINLFFPYETFGENLKPESGIFKFMSALPTELIRLGCSFITPIESANMFHVKGDLDVHVPISGQDTDKGLSAWSGNSMQNAAITKLYSMEDAVLNSGNDQLIHNWRKLQTSDHFYYMNTKDDVDGAARDSSSPYNSPHAGYVYFMNALADLELNCRNLPSQAN